MPADILSLSKARKARARAAKDAQAEENRVSFGRTKAEKLREKAEKTMADRRLSAHRLEPAPIATLKPRKPGADA